MRSHELSRRESADSSPFGAATASAALRELRQRSFSDALVEALAELGVEHAFGLFGGGIAPFCEALNRSPIRLMHFRHEAGAAFAAVEASLSSGRPVVVVATTGPGMTNMLTGMVAARWEGAKVIFVSGCTPASQRGRWAFQETSRYGTDLSSFFASGPIVNFGCIVEDPAELDVITARLASGQLRQQGFVAHIGLPLPVQTARVTGARKPRLSALSSPHCDAAAIETCVELLSRERFVIWAGFGARHAADAVRALAERTQAHVMCSPRAKGVMPERHPLYLGVTGLGGHAAVDDYMCAHPPQRTLVLGTRLGEFTSFWAPHLVPERGFIHVDLEADAFGAAYPAADTLGVQSDVRSFLDALLAAWPNAASRPSQPLRLQPKSERRAHRFGPVRPSALMEAIQRVIVEGSDAPIITEAGNSFALGSHYLRFDTPHRYRVSSGFGSMGHATCGVLGTALARRGKAVALVGDGAMLMMSELSTAAAYGVNAVWIVLNDARYNMIEQGMRSIGWTPFETAFPRADFVGFARALGVHALCVKQEAELDAALIEALAARGPVVVDVQVDPAEQAPTVRRNQSLVKQGVKS